MRFTQVGPMRIQIDATPLLLRSGGVKTYIYHWLRHLRRLAAPEQIRAFPFLGDFGELDHQKSVAGPAGTFARLALLHFANLRRNPALDWILPGTDVFHASNQVRNPPRRPRLTATIYDMTCWLLPQTHTPANVAADRRFAGRVLQQAAGLIAVSHSTKNDAVRLLNLDPDRVQVIHPGIAEPYFTPEPSRTAAVTARYRLTRPYILNVGVIEPRKNVDTLLDAYAQLSPAVKGEVELVVAGPVGWRAQSTAARLRSGLEGVRYLGYVPEPDLPALMAGAAVVAYPSLYEGFGLPVAQALASGVPVVVSNVSSLPEVAGDAGLLVDPRSPAEIRAALERLLLDPALRRRLGRRAAERAQLFRWESCAEQSLAFFRRVCGRTD